MNKDRILLIAPPNSYRLAPYIRAAKKLNIELLVASEGQYSLTTEVAFGLHIDFSNQQQALETIIAAARQKPFQGVIATDDFTVELVARVARALNLPHNLPKSAQLTRRKDLARQALLLAQLPIPKFTLIHLQDELEPQLTQIKFPCVLKPLALSASRGVIRVNNQPAYLDACQRIQNIVANQDYTFERSHILAEQYIPGIEIAVEAILSAGHYYPITIFDKPEPLEGPFFEETYYITPSQLESALQVKIHQLVAKACKAYGLSTGPIHAELRINGENLCILEVAARTIGGECAQLLEYATGHSLEELVISNAVGKFLKPKPINQCVGVLMIPTPKSGILRRIEGLLEAGKIKHIEAVNISIREGHELIQLPEGASYLGFIFARAPTAIGVETALRAAHAQLKIVVGPLFKLKKESLPVNIKAPNTSP